MDISSRLAVFSLCLIGFVLYLPSLFGQFVWDDEDFVYENQFVKEFRIDKFFTDNAIAGRGKISNYYRPIQETVYAITHAFFGYTPFFYHVTNVIVHMAAAVTVYYFFSFFSGQTTISFLTALIFLVHPVTTEAVSYISGLSDPLFVLFGFLSLVFYLKKQEHPLHYFMSIGCLFLSLLSKESGMVFTAMILVIWVVQERKNVKILVPYIALTAGYLLFHVTFINKDTIVLAWGNTLYAHSVWVRLATFTQNIFLYISLLFFPKDLFMERDFNVTMQQQMLNVHTVVFFVTNCFLLLCLWRLRKTKHFPMLLFCFFAFYLAFVPYTGIVLINGIFYEHFLYLPLVFFFGFLFFLFEKKLKLPMVLPVVGVVFVLLAIRNVVRQWDWMDPVRFYKQTLIHAPKSIRIKNNLGMAYADRDQTDQAIAQYLEAIALDPNIPNLYHNLGNVYKTKGEYKKAEENYLKAIEVNPKFFFSYEALIEFYKAAGQEKKAQVLRTKYTQVFGTH